MCIRTIGFIVFSLVISLPGLAQDDRRDKSAVTFEELYDEPYATNKLFVGFQPLYGEVFATNVNAGFGIDASYYHQDKLDFKLNFRKAYSATFYDLNRYSAKRNSDVENLPGGFGYVEIGGTYHVKDFDQESKTKMVLYKKSYKGDLWAARVPLQAEVPCKLRKIYGARLGGIFWNSTVDVNRVLESQSLTNSDLVMVNDETSSLPLTKTGQGGQVQDFAVFSNMRSAGLYAGASISWIRNIAVSFDKYEESIDDGMLTLYFDILYSPSLTIDNIQYQGNTYSTAALKKSPLGARVGLDGKFNRTLSWGYGGEVGYRPSFQGGGFFALFKISFPMYGTNLDYKVESFGK
jgi:hypothetical protein